MEHLNEYDEFKNLIEVRFKSKRNGMMDIIIHKTPDGIIREIEKGRSARFPYNIGQRMSRNIETWACNNNYLIDGKDPCPDKKIFGVKTKDVPQGHEWRRLFPNKFR